MPRSSRKSTNIEPLLTDGDDDDESGLRHVLSFHNVLSISILTHILISAHEKSVRGKKAAKLEYVFLIYSCHSVLLIGVE